MKNAFSTTNLGIRDYCAASNTGHQKTPLKFEKERQDATKTSYDKRDHRSNEYSGT